MTSERSGPPLLSGEGKGKNLLFFSISSSRMQFWPPPLFIVQRYNKTHGPDSTLIFISSHGQLGLGNAILEFRHSPSFAHSQKAFFEGGVTGSSHRWISLQKERHHLLLFFCRLFLVALSPPIELTFPASLPASLSPLSPPLLSLL